MTQYPVTIDSISAPVMTPFPQEKVPSIAAYDTEKGISNASEAGTIKPDVDQWNNMSEGEQIAFEKKLVRKLDLRLIPWLTLLYLFSYLDRASIGNAKILGV